MLDRLQREVPSGAGACGSTLLCLELLLCCKMPENNKARLLLYWMRLADISRQNQQAPSKLRPLMTPEGAWKCVWELKFNFIPKIDVGRGGVILWGNQQECDNNIFKMKEPENTYCWKDSQKSSSKLFCIDGGKREPKEKFLALRYHN